jgi:hypothetical protein
VFWERFSLFPETGLAELLILTFLGLSAELLLELCVVTYLI